MIEIPWFERGGTGTNSNPHNQGGYHISQTHTTSNLLANSTFIPSWGIRRAKRLISRPRKPKLDRRKQTTVATPAMLVSQCVAIYVIDLSTVVACGKDDFNAARTVRDKLTAAGLKVWLDETGKELNGKAIVQCKVLSWFE